MHSMDATAESKHKQKPSKDGDIFREGNLLYYAWVANEGPKRVHDDRDGHQKEDKEEGAQARAKSEEHKEPADQLQTDCGPQEDRHPIERKSDHLTSVGNAIGMDMPVAKSDHKRLLASLPVENMVDSRHDKKRAERNST